MKFGFNWPSGFLEEMMFENVDGWTSPCHVHIASHSVQALLEAFFHFFFKYKNTLLYLII